MGEPQSYRSPKAMIVSTRARAGDRPLTLFAPSRSLVLCCLFWGISFPDGRWRRMASLDGRRAGPSGACRAIWRAAPPTVGWALRYAAALLYLRGPTFRIAARVPRGRRSRRRRGRPLSCRWSTCCRWRAPLRLAVGVGRYARCRRVTPFAHISSCRRRVGVTTWQAVVAGAGRAIIVLSLSQSVPPCPIPTFDGARRRFLALRGGHASWPRMRFISFTPARLAGRRTRLRKAPLEKLTLVCSPPPPWCAFLRSDPGGRAALRYRDAKAPSWSDAFRIRPAP